VSIGEVVEACKAAGFEGDALVTMVAVGIAESGCNADATNDTRRFSERGEDGLWRDPNTGEALPVGHAPEHSIGWAQINIRFHQRYTIAECRDYERAAQIAWLLSDEGRDFSAWSGYRVLTGDTYAQAAHAVQASNDYTPEPPPVIDPVYLGQAEAMSHLVWAAAAVSRSDQVAEVRDEAQGLITLAVAVRLADFEAARAFVDDEAVAELLIP